MTIGTLGRDGKATSKAGTKRTTFKTSRLATTIIVVAAGIAALRFYYVGSHRRITEEARRDFHARAEAAAAAGNQPREGR